MQISLSELQANTEKYISMAALQDIYIEKNGKRVAKLSSAVSDKVAAAKALFGILPSDVDLDAARTERLSQ